MPTDHRKQAESHTAEAEEYAVDARLLLEEEEDHSARAQALATLAQAHALLALVHLTAGQGGRAPDLRLTAGVRTEGEG